MNIDEMREKILSAREQRALLRQQCSRSGNGSLSVTLNIPGYPKSLRLFSEFFEDVLPEFKEFMQAHRISIDAAREVRQIDEAGDFYLVPLLDSKPTDAIKALAETFEERHPLGRIIDIDVMDSRLQPITSGKLKKCLLCERPATVCMRETTHSYEELREHVLGRVRSYLSDRIKQRACKQLAALALKAILFEISASPKPGLVGRFEQGAHHDMDYFTFLSSTSVLAVHFEELALAGYEFEGSDLRDALPVIRSIGLKMEAAMFSATKGVNTQKGLIFLIGLSLFSASRAIAADGVFTAARCGETIAAICRGIVQSELVKETDSIDQTHGKTCFRRYGGEAGGVRKEAEDGLPAVFELGLPELKLSLAGLEEPVSATLTNKALIRTLLRLMTATNDTTILYRKDSKMLKTVQRMSQDVLDAKDRKTETQRYEQMLNFCVTNHVSPGGSADLLAVTVFAYFAEQSFAAPLKRESMK
jgi:holo-ACP synthase / triphosphoribosyl-dephospho-CoA synthase